MRCGVAEQIATREFCPPVISRLDSHKRLGSGVVVVANVALKLARVERRVPAARRLGSRQIQNGRRCKSELHVIDYNYGGRGYFDSRFDAWLAGVGSVGAQEHLPIPRLAKARN